LQTQYHVYILSRVERLVVEQAMGISSTKQPSNNPQSPTGGDGH